MPKKLQVTRFSIECSQYCEEHAAASKLFHFLCFLQFVRDEFPENVTGFCRHFITVLCQTDCVGTKRNDAARNRGDCISVVFKSFFAAVRRECLQLCNSRYTTRDDFLKQDVTLQKFVVALGDMKRKHNGAVNNSSERVKYNRALA